MSEELGRLLAVLPATVRGGLERLGPELDGLLEVVIDLGRRPEARLPGRGVPLREEPVSREELEAVVARVGEFGLDNRAGIEATLHRISAIRNRRGLVVGLTARVGRALHGTLEILRDVVESGRSLLFLGRPGVGKTTLLREIARVLADEAGRRVVVVDTSNEIAGDGDVPHPGIGSARRMQVPRPDLQHAVMIEAVENHMPEVVVVDEIGTEAEAYAARTIAERGVILVATAHGDAVENLLRNPTLSDLLGGVHAVTLSDEEARRRRTLKSIQERKAPPTFEVVIEIRDRDTLAIHEDVAEVVDLILRGTPPTPEIRVRTGDGAGERVQASNREVLMARARLEEVAATPAPAPAPILLAPPPPGHETLEGARIFPYALSRNRLVRAITALGVSARVVRHWEEADLVLTLRGQEKKRASVFEALRRRHLPVWTLKANTTAQMQGFLEHYFRLPRVEQQELALKEAEEALAEVLRSGQAADLSPQAAELRRLQHALVEGHGVQSRSVGVEPHRHVRIYKGEP